MIDIVFSDSACGGLKEAQSYGKGDYLGVGYSSVFITHADGSKPTEHEREDIRREVEEQERLAWERAVPMGGNPADVYGFPLWLSLGDISEDIPGFKRRQVLERLFSCYPDCIEGPRIADDCLQSANSNLRAVLDRAVKGETLRFWYSKHPDEQSGLFWFMAQLKELPGQPVPVVLVELPEWDCDEAGNMSRATSWSDVHPADFHRYVALQKPASPSFCQMCATHWRFLRKENAPLRASLNGRLMSAPDTLYDGYIDHEIDREADEFNEAMIIGRVLGNYPLGLHDGWVALRIEEMIRAGKLEAVTVAANDLPSYHRVLRKRQPC